MLCIVVFLAQASGRDLFLRRLGPTRLADGSRPHRLEPSLEALKYAHGHLPSIGRGAGCLSDGNRARLTSTIRGDDWSVVPSRATLCAVAVWCRVLLPAIVNPLGRGANLAPVRRQLRR